MISDTPTPSHVGSHLAHTSTKNCLIVFSSDVAYWLVGVKIYCQLGVTGPYVYTGRMKGRTSTSTQITFFDGNNIMVVFYSFDTLSVMITPYCNPQQNHTPLTHLVGHLGHDMDRTWEMPSHKYCGMARTRDAYINAFHPSAYTTLMQAT